MPAGQREKKGAGEEQEPQSSPPPRKHAAGVQPTAEKKCVAGDTHLARQAFPHGQKVGLLPWGQTHLEMLPTQLQSHEHSLSAAGMDLCPKQERMARF